MREDMPVEARSKLHKPLVRSGTNGQAGAESREIVPDDVQRWTARRRIALVLGILKGEMSIEEGARRHGLTAGEIEDWKERMLVAAHNALRSKPRDEEAVREEQFRRLKQKVGELVLEVDTLKEALRDARSGGADANDE
jgi:transposase-like protein